MTIRAFLRSLSFVAFMLVFAAPGFAADISAEMTALMSDVLKPYRTGTNLPSDANTDPKAVNIHTPHPRGSLLDFVLILYFSLIITRSLLHGFHCHRTSEAIWRIALS